MARRQSKNAVVEKLSDEVKTEYSKLLFDLACKAKDPDSPISDVAKNLMKNLMWRWTADAIVNGKVWIDFIKTKPMYLPATEAAIEVLKVNPAETKTIRHEHVVPREFLVNHIITKSENAEDVKTLMNTYCKAVIVTVKEDILLNDCGFRSSMPSGWVFDSSNNNCYARYHSTKFTGGRSLYDHLVHPEVNFND